MNRVEKTNRRAPLVWIATLFVTLLVGATVGWAFATVFTPPKDILKSTTFTTVEVAEGEVGASIALNTVAEWLPIPVGSNLASGVVTRVNVKPGDRVVSGSTLYTVNLRPVVVAEGATPAFRSLAEGSKGADVTQLQEMLTSVGLPTPDPAGTFGAGTRASVIAWQKAHDVDSDGVVLPGDIIFVPSLPMRATLDESLVSRGVSLSGGEEILMRLPAAPTFKMPVTETQAQLMPTDTRVEISGPKGTSWEGLVVGQEAVENEGIVVKLSGAKGRSICAKLCREIPIAGQSHLLSRVITVEKVEGLTVPSAALTSRADGSLALVDKSGNERTVTVLTSAQGMSIVEGVEAGLSVRVPASEE